MVKIFKSRLSFLSMSPHASKILNNWFNRFIIKKQLLLLCFLSSFTQFAPAQNTSYNANTIPVGGTISTAFGSGALRINTGAGNVANGYQTLYNNSTGKLNTAIGCLSLYTNSSGNYNVSIGSSSLYKNTTGYHNTANGYNTLYNNSTGNYNSASGSLALNKNTTGSNNTANGYQSLYTNTTGVYNVGIGSQALYFNSTGGANSAGGYQSLYNNTTGNENTANGYQAMYGNQSGSRNTANGYQSLYFNIGTGNTASGYQSLFKNNIGGDNVANGYQALYENVIGFENIAIGRNALRNNVDGYRNSAMGTFSLLSNINGVNNTAAGMESMYLNTGGSFNTAYGNQSLYYNTTGGSNTAIGDATLFNNITGSNNTGIGVGANVTATNFTNATAIGAGARVDGSNKVRIGNTSVMSIGGQVGWTIFSDARVKKNIRDDVPGLSFISLLKPVTYNYNIKKEEELLGDNAILKRPGKVKTNDEPVGKQDVEKIKFSGFVAQDVEAAAKKIGYEFSGIDNTGNIMGLRYSDFVVPLVKAVQELQEQVDELKKVLATKDAITIGTMDLSNGSVVLDQNTPNPFTNQTSINYNVPHNTGSAKILFYDMAGRLINSYEIKTKGKGQLTVFGEHLSSGTYTFSLVIDGKVINTKKLVKE